MAEACKPGRGPAEAAEAAACDDADASSEGSGGRTAAADEDDDGIETASVSSASTSVSLMSARQHFNTGGGVARATTFMAAPVQSQQQQQEQQQAPAPQQRVPRAVPAAAPTLAAHPLVDWLASRGATGGASFDVAAFANDGSPPIDSGGLSPLARLACAAWPDDRLRLCQCVLRRPTKGGLLSRVTAHQHQDITLSVVCPTPSYREFPLLVARRAGNGAFAVAAADEPTLAFALVEKRRDGVLESRVMASEDAPTLARLACQCTTTATRVRNGPPTVEVEAALACAIEEGRIASLAAAPPRWDAAAAAWRADLGGRPYKPSVKNCRLVEAGAGSENNDSGNGANVLAPGGPTLAQVGRLAASPGGKGDAAGDAFEVLFRRPLSAVQALCVALALVYNGA